jgi:hypothetical protein
MHTSSLITDMTLEEFAEWIVRYPYQQFWKRCRFFEFSTRLRLYGGRSRFFNAYADAKARRLNVQR